MCDIIFWWFIDRLLAERPEAAPSMLADTLPIWFLLCLYLYRCFLPLRSSSAVGCHGVSRETRTRRRRGRRRSSVDERRQRRQEDEVGSRAEFGQHQVNRNREHRNTGHKRLHAANVTTWKSKSHLCGLVVWGQNVLIPVVVWDLCFMSPSLPSPHISCRSLPSAIESKNAEKQSLKNRCRKVAFDIMHCIYRIRISFKDQVCVHLKGVWLRFWFGLDVPHSSSNNFKDD